MLGGLVSWVTIGLLGSTGRWCSVARCTRRGTPLTGATPHRQRPRRRYCPCAALIVAWALALSMDAPPPRVGTWVSLGMRRRRGTVPLWHTRGRCEGRVCSSTIAMACSGGGRCLGQISSTCRAVTVGRGAHGRPVSVAGSPAPRAPPAGVLSQSLLKRACKGSGPSRWRGGCGQRGAWCGRRAALVARRASHFPAAVACSWAGGRCRRAWPAPPPTLCPLTGAGDAASRRDAPVPPEGCARCWDGWRWGAPAPP